MGRQDTTFAPDDTPAGHAIAACLAMEGTVRSSALDWIILRGGFFYGPGTGYDDAWFAAAGAGEPRLPDDGSSCISLVHIADMAEATVRAISQWPSEQVLIVADDAPARWGDVLAWVAALAGGPSPQPGGRIGLPSYRVRNDRAREVPGWAPFYFLPRWASALTSLDYDRTARRPGGPSSPNTRGRDGAVSRLRWR